MAKVDSHDIQTLLFSSTRDFLVRNNGDQVKIDSLKGKKIGLYFSASWCGPCRQFTPTLIEVYNEIFPKGNFEIIFVSADQDDESFNGYFSKMPWLAIPFSDSEIRDNLDGLFKIRGIPSLVILDEYGKVVSESGVAIIREHGVDGYPFTLERIEELKEQEAAARRNQTLKSILVSGDLDFVIGKDGAKIPVADLEGKTILLYFSAHWCPPCRAFLPKLIEAYHKIKANTNSFEVIFISSDRDQTSFDDFFSTMPWLALPFGDARKASLSRKFKVRGIPMVIAIGPTGKTVSTSARELIMVHGADAYPFTEERLKEIKTQEEEMAKDWPKKLKHALHEEHELALSRRPIYVCDGCEEEGHTWSYFCEECNYDLHPKCALKEEEKEEEKESKDEEEANGDKNKREGWVCDGDVCSKA